MDRADPEVALHRALPGRALVEPASELLSHLLNICRVNIAVQPHQADVLLVVRKEQRGKAHCVSEHDEE